MVGLAQPLCLSALGIDGRRHENVMNRAEKENSQSLVPLLRLEAKTFSLCLAERGEVFVLTSPFIERDYR